MSLLVVASGVMLLAVPVATVRTRLSAAAQTRTACFSIAAGLWVFGVGILLVAAPLLMWWHDGEEATQVGLDHLSPGGPVAWAAGGVVGGLGVSWITSSLRRTITLRRRASLPRWAAEWVDDDDDNGVEVRIGRSPMPVAFAVPGRDPHVVISKALTGMLNDAELRAVLAHERAHLRLRHDRYLLVLAVYRRVWGWVPGVLAVVTDLRQAIEQWADSDAIAVGDTPERALGMARRTLATHHVCLVEQLPTLRRSSNLHLAGLAVVVAILIVSGGYFTTHTINDLAAAVAILH